MDNSNITDKPLLIVSEEQLRELLTDIVANIAKQPSEKIWVTQSKAMELLGLKSKTSMKKLRDTGAIEYTQPMKKIILYKYESIMNYLENYSYKTF